MPASRWRVNDRDMTGRLPSAVLRAATIVVVVLAAGCSSAPAAEPRAPVPARPSPAAAAASPASTVAAPDVATRIELHVEPLADLWLYLRMLAESRGREPVEPSLAELVDAVAELGRALRAAGGGWHAVDTQLHFATTVDELRRVFAEVPPFSAEHGGDPTVVVIPSGTLREGRAASTRIAERSGDARRESEPAAE